MSRKRPDGERAAAQADLRYAAARSLTIRRRRSGRGFTYLGADGRPIHDAAVLGRIRGLAVPPAWTDVWICEEPRGHLQAVGRDARGRKQYRYHRLWRQIRDGDKFARLSDFERALPRLRRRVTIDLRRPGLPREKVLAAVVRLLETTFLRVGNEQYARDNHAYGLSTLRNRHAKVNGSSVKFLFRGKGGKEIEAGIDDGRVARVIKRCQELPGQLLFMYLDEDGAPGMIDSADVNEYLQRAAGPSFTAKDFRTWAATAMTARALAAAARPASKAEASRNVIAAIKAVGEALGNTPAVCRRSYIHPAVIDDYLAAVEARSTAG